MRRKTMGGKRKNKSSKAQRRMKKMVGGALVNGSGIVIDNDTLTVEWGEYPSGSSPIFNGDSTDVEGSKLNFHIAMSDGGKQDVIKQFLSIEPMEGQKWSTTIDGILYNLTYNRYNPPKPSEQNPNGKFVFTIVDSQSLAPPP